MPSLAIFLHHLTATGVARNAIALARHMSNAGWDVTIVTVRPGGELAALADGLRHVVLGSIGIPRKLELLASVRRLRRQLDALAPDIVLSAGNHAHPAIRLALRKLRGPLPAAVYRISNDLMHNADPDSLRARLSSRRLLAERVVQAATRLVLVSPHLADDPLLAEALRSGEGRVIANGVDVALIRERAQEPCGHPWAEEVVPIVLGVGRLARQKNFGRLIEAFARARAVRPLRLVIVGGGKRKAREGLERLAGNLGIANDVSFVGRVANPFPYFRMASVLALPSVWEGSANVLLEALACDLPAVASRLAGNAEDILDHGRYGVLVDPHDIDEMAQAILAQLDPARCIRPGARAAAYDSSRTLAAYQSLFEELAPAN